jgi:hypothetical protein
MGTFRRVYLRTNLIAAKRELGALVIGKRNEWFVILNFEMDAIPTCTDSEHPRDSK